MAKSDGLKALGMRNGRKLWSARLYWIDPRNDREHEKRVTFEADSRHLARIERARRIEAARAGTSINGTGRRRVEAAGDEWFATVESTGSRISWGSHLRKIKARMGDQWIDTVTRPELQAWLDSLTVGPGTVNSVRDVLIHVFRLAVRKGYCTTNPASDTERRSTRRPVTMGDLGDAPKRALTPDEARALLVDMRDHEPAIYPLVATQFVLGCRFAEVSALKWEDIDLATGLVQIRRGQMRGKVGPTKGRYARTAALGPIGLRIVTDHKRRMEAEQWPGWHDLVFPGPPEKRGRRASDAWSISTAWHIYQRSFKRLGLEMRTATHSARHSMISAAATMQASEALLRGVVGHKSREVHQGYQTSETAQVIDLGARVEGRFLRTGTKTGSARAGKRRTASK